MAESRIRGSARRGIPDETTAGGFTEALARWASGVAVLAVRDEGRVFGITITAFSSVSLDPPLVLACLGRNAVVLPTLLQGEPEFVVNILAEDQRRLASIFTDVGPLGRDAFPATGAPVLHDALASLVCRVNTLHEAGDHWIVVGQVQEALVGRRRPPLLRHGREWRRIAET